MRFRRLASPALLLFLAACAKPAPPRAVPAVPVADPVAVPAPAPPPPPSPAVLAAAPKPAPAATSDEVVVLLCAAGERAKVVVSFVGTGSIQTGNGRREVPPGARVAVRFEAGPGGPLVMEGDPAGTSTLIAGGKDGQGFLLDGKSYPGLLAVLPGKDGSLVLRNTAPLPDYLAGVLAGELYPDSPPESLRALAILARSFALAHLEDLTDDPGQHQAYRGVPAATALPALRAAVASTEGLRLVSGDGKPLPGYWYHSTCGGHTADASIVFGAPPTPAYAGVACPHCTESKYYQWETEMPEALVRKALGLQEGVTGLSVVRRSPDGRARTLQARLKGGTARESAALSLRSALGPNLIRSTRLSSIESIPGDVQGGPVPRAFRFRGRGWGHGVGLCQIGAMTMARAGCPAEEILAFYYPGSRLVRVDR